MSEEIRLLAMDCDGVLTAGEIFHGTGGIELKSFHVRDGMGITLAKRAGIVPVIITVRESEAVRRRAEELKIKEIHQGVHRKWECLEGILERRGVDADAVAYIGDDLVDLPVMRRVGLPIAAADAVDEVKDEAKWITSQPGGRGAVREAVEMILKRDKKWERVLQELFDELS